MTSINTKLLLCNKENELNGDRSSTDPFFDDIFENRSGRFQKQGKSHWSIAWSDLMMTMFILFAAMYIFQSSKMDLNEKPKSIKPPLFSDRSANNMDIKNQSFPHLYEMARKKIPDVADIELIDDTAVRIILTNNLLFEAGKTELKYNAKSVLRKIGRTLKENQYMVNIVGHTDDLPIHSKTFSNNWELSAMRACSVAKYLIRIQGVPANRFMVSGQASHKPLVPNKNTKNRQQNRRVEIIISKQ